MLELEIDAESPAADRRIREIAADFPGGVAVGAITRDGAFVTPRGKTAIQTGDHVVLFTETSTIDGVLDLF